MLIAPRAAGGAAGPKLRPENPAQVRLAGRQEGGIHLRGRQGWAGRRGALRGEERGSRERGKKKAASPKLFAK